MAQRQAEALAGEDGEGEDGGKKKRKRGKKGDKGEKKEAEGKKGGEITGGKCYRYVQRPQKRHTRNPLAHTPSCNSSLHSLSRCPKRVDHKDPTPFATCFVCLGKGHLSAACPQNPKGVYVNGGCCKVCKSVAHRARDCPEEARQRAEERGADWHDRQRNSGIAPQGTVGTGARAGADEDDFMVTSRDFVGNRTRHAPANNGQRRPAKAPGAEGAFVPEAAAAPAAKPVVKKKKVVAF
jgi:zinc finger CCHC domain-containing protein 9